MTTVKLTLSPEELEILDNQATIKGSTRAQALRSRAFTSRNYNPQSYAQLVSKASRLTDLPRHQVERIVNYVFVEVMEPCVQEAN